ncbi:hypothetical protein FHX37_4259 [Haloactinospora alba]|uniref:Uncharacterized protein n=1 Tax=Haloactinospora alba TaxID=405555 RepID=A0A543N6T7_9ACTN|nr:hypothetical protein [Haloactinospora alba]TQN27538.1 hypothetical protein FHX37_4259 [Haloactinospora alba]
MAEQYRINVPGDALREIVGNIDWLTNQAPEEQEEISRLVVVIEAFGLKGQLLPLSLKQAQLLAAPGLWGIRRHDYENYMAQFKSLLIDHGRVDLGV